MAAREGYKLRLEPQDEYTHTPDAASNYNESMYFNVFDPKAKIGGWFRLGNRPNEGQAEMTTCLYLPDGRVAFMYGKPKISDNAAMTAFEPMIPCTNGVKSTPWPLSGTSFLS